MLGLLDIAWSYHHWKSQHLSCICRQNHTIVPKPCSWIVTTWLLFIRIQNRLSHPLLLFFWQLFTVLFQLGLLHLSQHTCSLFSTHYCNFSTWPHVQHSWAVGSSAHSVVTSSIWSSDDACDLWNTCCWNSIDHFSTMLCNTLMLVFLSNHKTSDILQKDQRNFSLWANLNKVGTFLGAFTEKNTIVGYNTDLLVVNSTETSQKSWAIFAFILMEFRTIQNSCQHLSHIESLLVVRRDNVIEFFSIVKRLSDVW